jgi:lysylphosphatidylglycerol synthetase-like protein (DUF2156 family)
MNKYQKQALLDMLKFAGGVVIVIAVVQTLVRFFSVEDLTVAGSFILMIFCFYNLFQIRVNQLKADDERSALIDKLGK